MGLTKIDQPAIFRHYLPPFLILLLLQCAFSFANEDSVSFSFRGVLDGRFVQTDRDTSWLDGSLGKTRYGGEDGQRRSLLRLSQLSGVLSIRFHENLSARVQINLDADPDTLDLRSTVDVVESFLSFHPVLAPNWRWSTRGGVFFPPVSMENRGPAWTTPYTITTSVTNSWIGEEVHVTGIETGLTFSSLHELRFRAAVFGNNDPAGTLLAWRGWVPHDRQTGLTDHLPLASIPAIQPGGLFPEQPPFVEPFREIDHRLGYYGTFSWRSHQHEFNIIYYDNRGDPTIFDGVQYAWKTDFTNAGLSIPIGNKYEILTQYMFGQSRMGVGDMVKIDFRSWYLLLSATFGKNRITGRYDDFNVRDRDEFEDLDNNNEDGSAVTLAYIYRFSNRYRLAFELLRVASSRPARQTLGQPIDIVELVFQTSFRITF